MNFDLLKKFQDYQKLIVSIFLLPLWFLVPYIYKFLIAFGCIISENENITPTCKLYWYIYALSIFLCVFVLLLFRPIARSFKRIKQVTLSNGKPCSIALLISCDDEIAPFRDKICKKVEEQIYSNGLKNIIICDFVKDKTLLEKYVTRADARSYKEEFPTSLVIVSKLESGKKDGKIFYSIPYIHLAFNTPIMPNMKVFDSLKFNIQDSESLRDIKIVGQNLYFLSNMFLALGLFCSCKFSIADKLVSSLYDQVSQLKNDKDYLKVYILTIDLLARIKNAIFLKEYQSVIKPNITKRTEEIDRIVTKQISVINTYSEKGLISFDGVNLKSILLFHLGEIKESRKILKDAKKTFKGNERIQLCCDLSLAFLYMWNGMYKLALKKYKSFKNIPFETAQSIIEFNEMVIKNNHNRSDLLFIIAVMRNFEYPQYELTDWNNFISTNKETTENLCLFEFAKARIDQLNKIILT